MRGGYRGGRPRSRSNSSRGRGDRYLRRDERRHSSPSRSRDRNYKRRSPHRDSRSPVPER
jgi:hypothetical protein